MQRPCLDCGNLVPSSWARCVPCQTAVDYRRNHDPKRAGYRRPEYLAQPKEGICHLCGKQGSDTRDHLVPLADDPTSLETRPAHRACNSARGRKVQRDDAD